MNRMLPTVGGLAGIAIASTAIFLWARRASDIPANDAGGAVAQAETPSADGGKGETIFEAVKRGDKQAVDVLLSSGVDADSRDGNGYSILQNAALGYTDIVALLIRRGASVNAQDKRGDTALHIAVFAGELQCAELLLKNGALPNAKTRSGKTPLFDAVQYDDQAMMRALLSAGASVKAADVDGNTCMHVLAMRRRGGEQAVASMKVLIEHGADINAENRESATPLMAAVSEGGTLQAIEYLLCNGGHIGIYRETSDVIHWAASSGRADVVRYLLSRGDDVNAKDFTGSTPLHYAAFQWRHGVVQLLVSKGALVDSRTEGKATPLLHAVEALARAHATVYRDKPMPQDDYERSMETVECLLAAGADVKQKDKAGKTPFACAVDAGLNAVTDLMEKYAGRTKDSAVGLSRDPERQK